MVRPGLNNYSQSVNMMNSRATAFNSGPNGSGRAIYAGGNPALSMRTMNGNRMVPNYSGMMGSPNNGWDVMPRGGWAQPGCDCSAPKSNGFAALVAGLGIAAGIGVAIAANTKTAPMTTQANTGGTAKPTTPDNSTATGASTSGSAAGAQSGTGTSATTPRQANEARTESAITTANTLVNSENTEFANTTNTALTAAGLDPVELTPLTPLEGDFAGVMGAIDTDIGNLNTYIGGLPDTSTMQSEASALTSAIGLADEGGNVTFRGQTMTVADAQTRLEQLNNAITAVNTAKTEAADLRTRLEAQKTELQNAENERKAICDQEYAQAEAQNRQIGTLLDRIENLQGKLAKTEKESDRAKLNTDLAALATLLSELPQGEVVNGEGTPFDFTNKTRATNMLAANPEYLATRTHDALVNDGTTTRLANGTNENLLRGTLSQITADNVMDVISSYNNSATDVTTSNGSTISDRRGFMEDILADLSGGEQVTQVTKVLTALEARAAAVEVTVDASGGTITGNMPTRPSSLTNDAQVNTYFNDLTEYIRENTTPPTDA